eukprot:31427-Pelagococcus_subviridis.AAC.4
MTEYCVATVREAPSFPLATNSQFPPHVDALLVPVASHVCSRVAVQQHDAPSRRAVVAQVALVRGEELHVPPRQSGAVLVQCPDVPGLSRREPALVSVLIPVLGRIRDAPDAISARGDVVERVHRELVRLGRKVFFRVRARALGRRGLDVRDDRALVLVLVAPSQDDGGSLSGAIDVGEIRRVVVVLERERARSLQRRLALRRRRHDDVGARRLRHCSGRGARRRVSSRVGCLGGRSVGSNVGTLQ